MLFSVPVLNGPMYRPVNNYVLDAKFDLDSDGDRHFTTLYLGDSELCGDVHRELRNAEQRKIDARESKRYREQLVVPGWEDWNRLREMRILARMLGLAPEDLPGFFFLSRKGTKPLAVLRIQPRWFESLSKLCAFHNVYRRRIRQDDFKALALSGWSDSRLSSRLNPVVDDIYREIDSAVQAGPSLWPKRRRKLDARSNTLVILTSSRSVYLDGKELDLKGAQYQLFLGLARRPGELIPVEELAGHAAKRGSDGVDNPVKWGQDNKYLLLKALRKMFSPGTPGRKKVDALITAKNGCLRINLAEEEITIET